MTHAQVSIIPRCCRFWPRLLYYPATLPSQGFPACSPPFSSPNFPRTDAARRAALINALDSTQRGMSNEAACLLAALGVHPGFAGLLLSFRTASRGGRTKTLEHKQLEQRAWVRLAELAVFDRMSRSLLVISEVLTPS
jgi:hypothetical protein